MRWMGHVARTGREEEEYIELWRENVRGRLLRRSCHRWEDAIKTDLQEIEFENMD
jgi:hypothetical protein